MRVVRPWRIVILMCYLIGVSAWEAYQCDAGCDVLGAPRSVTWYWRQWQTDWETYCWNVEADVDIAMLFNGSADPLRSEKAETELTDNPRLRLWALREALLGARVALLSTHGRVEGSGGTSMGVEYFATRAARRDATTQYYSEGYQSSDFVWGKVPEGTDTAYVLSLTDHGILEHFSGIMEEDAVVYADYCSSVGHANDWCSPYPVDPLDGPSYMGYDLAAPWDVACSNLRKVWCAFGCRQIYPPTPFDNTTGDVHSSTQDLTLLGNIENRLNCTRSCHWVDAVFVGSGAFDGIVWWRTRGENRSRNFVVRGFEDVDADPEILAVVPAKGGRGVVQHYWIRAAREYSFYDVVERDSIGGQSHSPVFCPGVRPSDWNHQIANPRRRIAKPEMVHAQVPLVELVGNQAVPLEDRLNPSPSMPAEPPGPPPDDTYCADVVIYSSEASFITPVSSHVAGEGLKVRSFVGSTNPDDARTAYGAALAANEAYLDACDADPYWREHCKEYPVYPGPLLIIVGDSNPNIVSHETLMDDNGLCRAGDTCMSDFDITDLDGDGRPEGPVTRIPAETLQEVQRSVMAAQDFNAAAYVDQSFRLVTIAGDNTGRYWDARALMEKAESSYVSKGFLAGPTLIESDHLDDDRTLIGSEAINAGALEIWGLGLVTAADMWPGQFVLSASASSLTSKQRFLAWIPDCHTASPYEDDSIAELLATNDPEKSMAAAFVGYLAGAYQFQHEGFTEILLAERMSAQAGTPVANIVWQAVRCAQTKPLLFDYARSVGVLGGYVKIPGYVCGSELGCAVESPAGGEVWDLGTVHSVEWRLCHNPGADGLVRKHEVSLTRDGGATWETLADSVAASAREYEWTVDGDCSFECLARVITRMDTLRTADSLWVSAYACTCLSEDRFFVCRAAGAEPTSLVLSLMCESPISGEGLVGRFSVPSESDIVLDVFDVRGRLVKRLAKIRVKPGDHQFEWDLRSASGPWVAPGLYFLRLSTPQKSITRKVVICQ